MLRQIQEDFYAHVINAKNLDVLAHTCPVSDIKSRLSIYRRSIYEKLRRALEITFPNVWKVLGKECADNAAYAFLNQKEYWPSESILEEWGYEFPYFLKEFSALSHLVYLFDIAMLDGLRHLSYIAADNPALNEQAFKSEFDNNPETFSIALHPCVFLWESHYYLLDIYDVLEKSADHSITLKKQPSFCVISRQDNEVISLWVSKDLFCFLFCIKKELPLATCYEKTYELHPDFDITEAIKFILSHKLICSVTATTPLI